MTEPSDEQDTLLRRSISDAVNEVLRGALLGSWATEEFANGVFVRIEACHPPEALVRAAIAPQVSSEMLGRMRAHWPAIQTHDSHL